MMRGVTPSGVTFPFGDTSVKLLPIVSPSDFHMTERNGGEKISESARPAAEIMLD